MQSSSLSPESPSPQHHPENGSILYPIATTRGRKGPNWPGWPPNVVDWEGRPRLADLARAARDPETPPPIDSIL
jgi:hypothetical protein